MNINHSDPFENEAEVSKMVEKLHSQMFEQLNRPDIWDIQGHSDAIKSATKMGKKVLAKL